MKITPKLLMNKYRHFYNALILLLLSNALLNAQSTEEWTELTVIDTMQYSSFSTNHIPDNNYPPGHLFDADYNTCWVSKLNDNNSEPSIYFALPHHRVDKLDIRIFPGYGKSKSLFLKNARPEEITLSLYTGIIPDGYVSETASICKVIKLPYKQTLMLKDTFGLQNFSIQYPRESLQNQQEKILSKYDAEFTIPPFDTLTLVKLEIVKAYEGSTYDDICISEIFFNDCYISSAKEYENIKIHDVFINEQENTLLADIGKDENVVVFKDTTSVLQIAEISKDKKWAVTISMPAEISGRAETSYQIFDLLTKEDISQQLEEILTGYNAGEPLYLEQNKGKNYLVYPAGINEKRKIELRSPSQ